MDVTDRKKRKRENDNEGNTMTASLKEMFATFSIEQEKRFNSLHVTVNSIKNQNEELRKSVDTISCKYDEFIKRIEDLEEERKEDKKYITTLEEKVELLERKSRATAIEIRNYPKLSKTEYKQQLCSMVIKMGTVLNVNVQEADLKDVFRANPKDSE